MIITALRKFIIDRWAVVEDEYLTWKTGRSTAQRILEAFVNENVRRGGTCIGGPLGVLGKFKYIIEVGYARALDPHPILGYTTTAKFVTAYRYPNVPIERHCVVISMRGGYTNDKRIFANNEICGDDHIFVGTNSKEEICGDDHIFVGTNSKEDATMIALLFK